MKYTKEELEQIAFVNYLSLLENQEKIVFFFAIQNEIKTRKGDFEAMIQGKKAKEMGKRAGVSDLCVILKDKVLFFEMKRKREKLKSGRESRKNLASKAQMEFLHRINTSCKNAKAFICYGAKEAIEILEKELNEQRI